AEQRPQDQERRVVGRERRKYFDHRIEDQIEHQWQTPAVTVRQQSENERAYGPERKRQRNGERHRAIVLVKFPADRGQTVDHQEKVERVKHPGEESCGDCFSVIVRRRAQEAHSLSITVLSKSAQRFNSAMGTFSPVLCAVSISPGPNTTVSELSAPRCGASV